MPPGWQPFTVRYRYRDTFYAITVVPAEPGAVGVTLDGVERAEPDIPLENDGAAHTVEVRVTGAGVSAPKIVAPVQVSHRLTQIEADSVSANSDESAESVGGGS